MKFGFPMAWSATTLAWGAIEFVDAYKQAAEYQNMLKSLKWVADYFVKAHTAKYEFWGQVRTLITDFEKFPKDDNHYIIYRLGMAELIIRIGVKLKT